MQFFIDVLSPYLLRSRLCTFLIINAARGCVLVLRYFCRRENLKMAWLGSAVATLQPRYLPKGALAELLHGMNASSLQHPWEGAKCCRPVSTDGEGGGLGGTGTGSHLRSLPSARGCRTAAPSPRRCLLCCRAAWSSSSPAERLQEELVMKKGRVSGPCPKSGF